MTTQGFYTWSRTAASNATADGSVNWAEGQPPSSINDSARAMMARTAEYRDDIAGAIVTGGTATAFTVSSYQVFDTLAHLSGQMIAFAPNATSTNAVGADVTLNVDSLGAKPIRMQPSVALPGGTLVSGTPYVAVYNNSDGVFYLQNMVNPYVIPLAAGMDFWGSTTPNSSFAFPAGQAISRTTYATLFSLLSTTYGTGDGSTTFNLPDKTGRVSAMKEASATRLTTAGGGVDGGTMGATGGAQNETLSLLQVPGGITTAGTANVTGTATNGQGANITAGGPILAATFASGTAVGNSLAVTASGTSAGTSNNTGAAGNGTGAAAAHINVQPTIVCNYIIRII